MKNKKFRVVYRERPLSEKITRLVIAYSPYDVKSFLKFEDEVTKNNLVVEECSLISVI